MKKLLPLILLMFSLQGLSQNTMIVFLKNKSSKQGFDLNSTLSKRSLIRRANKRIQEDSYDFPITNIYLQKLAAFGEVEKQSKWLNAVIYSSPLSPVQLQDKFDFIERVEVFERHKTSTIEKEPSSSNKALNYGFSRTQIEQLNLDCLHDQGYTGTGIYLAIIDAGFTNMNTVSYFDSLFLQGRVLDTWDFPLNNADVFGNSSHGTAVSSCIVGQNSTAIQPYIGTAKDVDIALYRSEVAATETVSEEFDLVLALERCDSVGVDIANISLGYFGFDDTLTNHIYADMDGNTTIAALGVDIAASKGIAVVIAAGNGGPGKISTPCDADSCLCIGAVDSLSNYAFFSSVGPSSDGQVKPDVVARGLGAWVVTPQDTVLSGNGTSFASPITCGATACLMQANPTKSVQEVFDAIRESADQFNTPDSLRGYGLPDFCLADQILKGTAGVVELKKEKLIYPNPTTDFIHFSSGFLENKISVRIINSTGQEVFINPVFDDSKIDVKKLPHGIYVLEIISDTQTERLNFVKN